MITFVFEHRTEGFTTLERSVQRAFFLDPIDHVFRLHRVFDAHMEKQRITGIENADGFIDQADRVLQFHFTQQTIIHFLHLDQQVRGVLSSFA